MPTPRHDLEAARPAGCNRPRDVRRPRYFSAGVEAFGGCGADGRAWLLPRHILDGRRRLPAMRFLLHDRPGDVDEIKAMHRELRPEKVFYCTHVANRAEGEALLDWFARNS